MQFFYVLITIFCIFGQIKIEAKSEATSIPSGEDIYFPSIQRRSYREFLKSHRSKRSLVNGLSYIIADAAMDALRLNFNLFHVDSAKILTGFTPIYIVTRRYDEELQSHFYDPTCHKNIRQLPQTCHSIAKYGVSIPIIGLSFLMISRNENLSETARIFAIGIPFVHWGKHVISDLRLKNCLRPWHQDFSSVQRSSGGFPSGHMADIAYAAVLFGLRMGPRWALPISAFAAFVFVDFVNCNRHYLSQLVAGAGLGFLYAFAADKIVERRLDEHFAMGIDMNRDRIAVSLTYMF